MPKWIKRSMIFIGLISSIVLFAKEESQLMPGMKAPVFNIKQLNGKLFNLDTTKTTIIWFFAPWCEFAISDYPFMAKDCQQAARRLGVAYQTYGHKFNWIGVSTRSASTESNVNVYRNKHKIGFSVAIDKTGRLFALYRVAYSPTVIIIHKGRVYYREKSTLPKLEKTLKVLAVTQVTKERADK